MFSKWGLEFKVLEIGPWGPGKYMGALPKP